jgi:hypothetical protein
LGEQIHGAPWNPDQLIRGLVELKYKQNVYTVVSFEETHDKAKPDYSVGGKIQAEKKCCKQLDMNFVNILLDQITSKH